MNKLLKFRKLSALVRMLTWHYYDKTSIQLCCDDYGFFLYIGVRNFILETHVCNVFV